MIRVLNNISKEYCVQNSDMSIQRIYCTCRCDTYYWNGNDPNIFKINKYNFLVTDEIVYFVIVFNILLAVKISTILQ